MSSPAIDLTQFDSEYRRQNSSLEGKPQGVPDGKYHVIVENIELIDSKSSGQPMLKWTLRILGPSHQNRLMWKNTVISQKSMRIVADDLKTCGMVVEPFSHLPKRLGELLDIQLEVTKKTKDTWENIYLNKRLDLPADVADDDLPF